MNSERIKILAISGSLRANSSATMVLHQVAGLIPEQIEFTIYQRVGQLPHFDDSEKASSEVVEFRKLLSEAHGVLICTPEYAFGVPGSLKNALDWTVSSGEFVNKPVALITASSSGDKAHASLLLTLTAISATVTDKTTLLIPFIRSKLNESGEFKDMQTLQALKDLVTAFVTLLRKKPE